MAKRTKAVAKPATDDNRHALNIVNKDGKTNREVLAVDLMNGTSRNGITTFAFSDDSYLGRLGMTECIHALEAEIDKIHAGDMRQVETMLFGQATALSAVFNECARRAHANMGEYPDAMERYMRLAFRAQSQCRTTLEALVEAKNPKSVAFVRQANIANGHQQVNNGGPRAGQLENPPNELQEAIHGRPVAAGAETARVRADQGSATVVEIDRAQNARRQG